jgi:CRP-like cAMP-binding protein
MDRYENFRLFHDINVEDYELLTRNLKSQKFKKGDQIITPGQVQRKLYFVKSGVQMAYFDTGDKIRVIIFTSYPDLLLIPDAFSFQRPSKYYFTCLTDSELEYITFEEFQQILDQSRQIERFFRKMMEFALADMIHWHIELYSMTIDERYKSFCQIRPQLLSVVPHKYIASYLGIDPTNFSKLFNNVMF